MNHTPYFTLEQGARVWYHITEWSKPWHLYSIGLFDENWSLQWPWAWGNIELTHQDLLKKEENPAKFKHASAAFQQSVRHYHQFWLWMDDQNLYWLSCVGKVTKQPKKKVPVLGYHFVN